MKLDPPAQKVLGMLLIVIFLIIELVLLVVLVVNLLTQSGRDTSNETFSFLFVLILFFFPLKFGFNLWKKGRLRSQPLPRLTDTTQTVTVTSTIDFPAYQRLAFFLMYSRPIYIFYNFIATVLITSAIVNRDFNYLTFLLILIVAVLPISVAIRVRGNYKSQVFLKEPCTYQLTHETLSITGHSFSATHQWSSVYKIQELKNWLLIYTGQTVALIIQKKSFKNAHDIDQVRAFAAHNGIYIE